MDVGLNSSQEMIVAQAQKIANAASPSPQQVAKEFDAAFKAQASESITGIARPGLAPEGSASSGNVVKSFIDGVGAKQQVANESRRAFLSGESNNIHQTMIAGQEASVAFSLMVEVRNKVMEAYQELMRIQI